MWLFRNLFLMTLISDIVGDQYKYTFAHEKVTLEDLDTKVVDANGELYTVAETKALNGSFVLKIDLPVNTKVYVMALRGTNHGYTLPLIQFSKTVKDALDMTAFGLQKFLMEYFQPPVYWPLQKGITYRTFGWTPDATKFPSNLPAGKWKLQLTFKLGNQSTFAVANWYLKIVYV